MEGAFWLWDKMVRYKRVRDKMVQRKGAVQNGAKNGAICSVRVQSFYSVESFCVFQSKDSQ